VLNSKYTNCVSFIDMSKGLGKVEQFIRKTLDHERQPCSVSLLSVKYCRSCGVRFDKPSGKMLYHSVARAVRSLEEKGYVKTEKMSLKELGAFYERRYWRNNQFDPIYVKLVHRANEPEF